MAYYESRQLTLMEAIRKEILRGFDSADEKREVMIELADEYGVTLEEVMRAYLECTRVR